MKFLIIFFLLAKLAFAGQLKVEVIPENPIFGESFEVKFIIHTESSEEPDIQFDPIGLRVENRSNTATSTRISYINGNSTVEKTMSISYEMSPLTIGGAFLRKIKVKAGDEILTHPTLKIDVLKEPRAAKKVFVQVEIDKPSVYVGESFMARYYLYNLTNVSISNAEISKFPKLDKFLKRFHQENYAPEKVRVDGKIYIRRIMYTAQLFANKAGKFAVDPIVLRVRHSDSANLFGFGSIGFSNGRSRNSTISSKIVKMEVMDLPANGMDSYFTGLVGKHKFSLKANKNKFIVNEPIELQLTVEGEGALELYEAPTILKDPALEEFDKTSDFQIKKDFTSIKKINYTYLGREGLKLPEQKIKLSYFDPEKKQYITQELDLNEISIAGTGGQVVSSKDKKLNDEKNVCTSEEASSKNTSVATPFEFKPLQKSINTFLYFSKELFWIFLLLTLFTFAYLIYQLVSGRGPKSFTLLETIFREGVSYQYLHRLLSEYDSSKTMTQIVDELDVSEQCQNYFTSLINTMNKIFAEDKTDHKIVVNKKFFKELNVAIRQKKGESS